MIRSRLAPTPSGYLHLGNIYNFALTWALVRKTGGQLSLRIDDLDATRTRDEFIADIFDTLKWLGFDWDEGPKNSQEFARTYSQCLRLPEYRNALSCFTGFACECTRQSVKTIPCECRLKNLPLIPYKTQFKEEESGVVLWRKDDLPAYHLVSVLEDVRTHMNLIVRGEDLRESSQIQLKLAAKLGDVAESFIKAKFIHHPLLLENGEKMSKSLGASSVKLLREQGHSPRQVWEELARRVGTNWKSLTDVSTSTDLL